VDVRFDSTGREQRRIGEEETVDLPAARQGHDGAVEDKSTLELVRSIASDTSVLVRKEMELARQEIVAAMTARMKAAGAMAAAGVLGLFVLGFLGAALASALDGVVAAWISRLIVAGVFVALAGVAAMFGLRRAKAPPLRPEETQRTLKEDVEWAKQQLRR
jgi:hypothetical protein